MKYIALKDLPNGIPAGTEFEENTDVGRVLISVGAAREADMTVQEPPAKSAPKAPKPKTSGRQYARRDMQAAEDIQPATPEPESAE